MLFADITNVGKSYVSDMMNAKELACENWSVADMISCIDNDLTDCCSDMNPSVSDIDALLPDDLNSMLDCEIFSDFSNLLLVSRHLYIPGAVLAICCMTN